MPRLIDKELLEKYKRAYITRDDNVRLPDLAKTLGVNIATLKGYANKYGWSKERKEYQANSEAICATITDADAAIIPLRNISDKLIEILKKALEDPMMFYKYQLVNPVLNEDGTMTRALETVTSDVFNSKAFKEVTSATKEALNLVRDAYGIPTKLEAEKLKLDNARLEALLTKDDIQKVEIVVQDDYAE